MKKNSQLTVVFALIIFHSYLYYKKTFSYVRTRKKHSNDNFCHDAHAYVDNVKKKIPKAISKMNQMITAVMFKCVLIPIVGKQKK